MSRFRWAFLAAGTAAACVGLLGCVIYLHPRCDDEIQNGSETDVDCGGACKPCAVGLSCRSGSDCKNGNCVGERCTPLPCFNGVQDGTETDVDCGGGTCRKCAGARHCLADSDCFSGTCSPGTSTCSSLQTVSFAAPVSYPAGYKTYAMFAGDLNGDGVVDLVAANEQDSSVSVFLGRGDGTFLHAGDFATGAYPTGGAIADLNRDGIPDILTANWHGNSISVLIGNGDGTFQAAQHYPAALETQNLAVGDLNGDGYPDVVAVNLAASSMSLFMGRADGTLDPAVNITVGVQGASSPYSVAMGDFNGDGKLDVAIADVTGGNTIVRLGRGDGTFDPEVRYRGTGWITTYDVNLDGRLDLVIASGDTIMVLLGAGDGTFLDPIVSTAGLDTRPFTLAIGDFNRDGVPDVVTANFSSSTVSVLLGVGDGSFEAPIGGGETGTTTYGVVVGDFNGDGKPDFATCNASANDMKVSLNTSY